MFDEVQFYGAAMAAWDLNIKGYKMMKSTRFMALSLFIPAIFLSGMSNAERFNVDAGLGFSTISTSGYKEAAAFDASFAYKTSGLALRAGALSFSNFELKGRNLDEDSYIRLVGVHVGVAKEFKFDPLRLEIGGGLYLSEIEAKYLGRKVSEETDQSTFLNTKLVIDLNKLVALQADYKFIQDVHGSDMNVLTAGVRFSF